MMYNNRKIKGCRAIDGADVLSMNSPFLCFWLMKNLSFYLVKSFYRNDYKEKDVALMIFITFLIGY